jgi:hypothetical protein
VRAGKAEAHRLLIYLRHVLCTLGFAIPAWILYALQALASEVTPYLDQAPVHAPTHTRVLTREPWKEVAPLDVQKVYPAYVLQSIG